MLGWFSYFLIAQKTGSVMWGLVTSYPRLLSMLRLSTILLKNVLNVSASRSLFVIVLLFSFNVMHSLWKAFSKKRGLTVFQNFLLPVAIFFCLSFRNSLSYIFYAKYSRRDFFVYCRDFSLRSFFHVNICFEVLTFS